MVARTRDYKQEYARRKALASERGVTVRRYKATRTVERRNEARAKANAERRRRNHKASYQRLKESAAAHGRTVTQERKARREAKEASFGDNPSRAEILRHFGVKSLADFERMRNANLEYNSSIDFEELQQRAEAHSTEKARNRAGRVVTYVQMVNHYDKTRDIDGDYSLARMGYVITFYKAIVSPRTNYDAYIGAKQDGKMTPEIQKWQASYLADYATLGDAYMEYIKYIGTNEQSARELFKARYGATFF